MLLEKVKSLTQGIPFKWQPKYILKRIQEEDINISLETRNEVLVQLDKGGRYVQIGEYTIMLNAIKSIDPMWGDKNIPPRPEPVLSYDTTNPDIAVQTVTNQDEIDEWESYFGKDKI